MAIEGRMSQSLIRASAVLVSLVLSLCCRCSPLRQGDGDDTVALRVVDVGQGLAQIVKRGATAAVFDVGPAQAHARWRSSYGRMGSPYIAAICISHNHEDHAGGLALLDSLAPFSGTVVVGPRMDTAALRTSCGAWAGRVRFRIACRGDTLALLPGVSIACLWPAAELDSGLLGPGDLENRFSSCYKLTFENASALLAADIDTVAENAMSRDLAWGAKAGIVVAPHHGSAVSVSPLFWGYADPEWAVVSCAARNSYGHPCGRLYDMLYQMQVPLLATFELGDVTASSDGQYWRIE